MQTTLKSDKEKVISESGLQGILDAVEITGDLESLGRSLDLMMRHRSPALYFTGVLKASITSGINDVCLYSDRFILESGCGGQVYLYAPGEKNRMTLYPYVPDTAGLSDLEEPKLEVAEPLWAQVSITLVTRDNTRFYLDMNMGKIYRLER